MHWETQHEVFQRLFTVDHRELVLVDGCCILFLEARWHAGLALDLGSTWCTIPVNRTCVFVIGSKICLLNLIQISTILLCIECGFLKNDKDAIEEFDYERI